MKDFYLKTLILSFSLLMPHVLNADVEKDFLAAAKNNDVSIMRSLREQGVDLNGKYDPMLPLHAAAAAGATDAITYLLNEGVEPDAACGCMKTALHFAVQCNQEGAVRLLLERGASATAFSWADDGNGLNPLMYAAKYAGKNITELLIQHGACVGAINARGQTVYDIAYQQRKSRQLRILSSSQEMKGVQERAIRKLFESCQN